MSKNTKTDPALHFLHDLLNHTHGLKLYLESRNGNIEKGAIDLIYNEVQALENQIANQFNKIVSIEEYDVAHVIEKCLAQLDLYQLNYEYIPAHVGNSMDMLLEEKLQVNTNFFDRLVKNIAKNIYLWSDRDYNVEVHVSFHADDMQITFKNKISKDVNNIDISNGIGLHSMKKLASELGIGIETHLDEDHWISKLQIKLVGHCVGKLAC